MSHLVILDPSYASQHHNKRLYYQGGNQRWTADRGAAFVFTSSEEAQATLIRCQNDATGSAKWMRIGDAAKE